MEGCKYTERNWEATNPSVRYWIMKAKKRERGKEELEKDRQTES